MKDETYQSSTMVDALVLSYELGLLTQETAEVETCNGDNINERNMKQRHSENSGGKVCINSDANRSVISKKSAVVSIVKKDTEIM